MISGIDLRVLRELIAERALNTSHLGPALLSLITEIEALRERIAELEKKP